MTSQSRAAVGAEAADVSYAGHAMTDREVDAVASHGALFVADSLSQIQRYGHARPGADIAVRINCAIAAGFHPHVQAGGVDSKFGIHPPQLPEALALAERYHLSVIGLHTHLGSDLLDHRAHLEALDRLLELERGTVRTSIR